MIRGVVPIVSNNQADKAGDLFRAYMRGPGHTAAERREFARALQTISDYRAMHAYPLRKATMGVRVMIETELGVGAPRPGQRFKRLDRILDKLLRFPKMRLSQMEDIGGCRAVFADLEDLYDVAQRIHRRWPHARIEDRVDRPKADGYRSLHIVEKRDGRYIEVQLRTIRQHDWAQQVERWSGLTGYNLKDGRGPADLRLYFATAAERLAREDAGDPLDVELEDAFDRLREDVRHYFDPTQRRS